MPGGWYHITTRGLGKRPIYKCDRDHEHFIELLAGMVERYSIILHTHVELDNHYHLLMESPEGNVSQAMQWLNTSYSVWFNKKYERSGALFQNRFKSIPVDNEGSWAFECAMYVHLNPVRIRSLGLGKQERAGEKSGMFEEPKPELVLKRIDVLRSHRWSSYPAYAGYVEKPAWLCCEELWRRGSGKKDSDPKKEYREWLEDYLRQGVEENTLSRLTASLVIGSVGFKAGVRKRILKNAGERTDERKWRRITPFSDLEKAVSQVKGEPWGDFVSRYGDWGRDLAIYVARHRCGQTLKEIGGHIGMKDKAVSFASSSIRKRLELDKELRSAYQTTLEILGEDENSRI